MHHEKKRIKTAILSRKVLDKGDISVYNMELVGITNITKKGSGTMRFDNLYAYSQYDYKSIHLQIQSSIRKVQSRFLENRCDGFNG